MVLKVIYAGIVCGVVMYYSCVSDPCVSCHPPPPHTHVLQLVTTSSLAVCDQYGAVMEAIGASERVLAHLNDQPAPQLAPGIQPHEQLRGEVEMRGVSYSYPNR